MAASGIFPGIAFGWLWTRWCQQMHRHRGYVVEPSTSDCKEQNLVYGARIHGALDDAQLRCELGSKKEQGLEERERFKEMLKQTMAGIDREQIARGRRKVFACCRCGDVAGGICRKEAVAMFELEEPEKANGCCLRAFESIPLAWKCGKRKIHYPEKGDEIPVKVELPKYFFRITWSKITVTLGGDGAKTEGQDEQDDAWKRADANGGGSSGNNDEAHPTPGGSEQSAGDDDNPRKPEGEA